MNMTEQEIIDTTGIVTENVLILITGYTRRKNLMNCLDRLKIPYFLGKKGKIWTTLSAMNSRLISSQSKQQKRTLH